MTSHLDDDGQELESSRDKLLDQPKHSGHELTHQILLAAWADRRQHRPDPIDEASKLLELLRVFQSIEFSNLTDGRPDLLEWSRYIVVVLLVSAHSPSAAHISLELRPFPREIFP